MAGLRADPPSVVGSSTVDRVTDLAIESGGYPPTDALVLELDDRSRICVRPSGTEPKLKVYVEVVEPVGDAVDSYAAARADGARRVEALIDAFAPLLGVDAS